MKSDWSYSRAMTVRTRKEAKACLESLIKFGMSRGQSREKARRIQLSNIGYFTGYCDAATARRVMRLFDTAHPIFGRSRPTPEEAFKAGKRLAKK